MMCFVALRLELRCAAPQTWLYTGADEYPTLRGGQRAGSRSQYIVRCDPAQCHAQIASEEAITTRERTLEKAQKNRSFLER